jgi:peptide/nickel transport system permease protein
MAAPPDRAEAVAVAPMPAPAAAAAPAAPAAKGRLVRLLALPRRDPYALVGILIYLVFVFVAIFADRLATHDPLEILFRANGRVAANMPPDGKYLLGTTNLGRDVYSQLVYGARSALVVGLSAALIVVAIGTLVGLFAGYFGGWVDAALMRLGDIALSIPFLPFIIVLAAFLKPSTWNVVLGVAVLLWSNTGRIVRSQVLTVRERSYVEAARVTGASDLRILFVHVAPNILPISFLYGSIVIGWAIFAEASVSFLGFGPSDSVSWGYMLQDAFVSQALSRGSYNWFVPPGLCIMLVVAAGFFISRGYEELLFPKLRD